MIKGRRELWNFERANIQSPAASQLLRSRLTYSNTRSGSFIISGMMRVKWLSGMRDNLKILQDCSDTILRLAQFWTMTALEGHSHGRTSLLFHISTNNHSTTAGHNCYYRLNLRSSCSFVHLMTTGLNSSSWWPDPGSSSLNKKRWPLKLCSDSLALWWL